MDPTERAPAPVLGPGSIVDGRFTIEAEARSGGMGTVYRARDQQSGATVALKVMRPGETEVARFEREARILEQIAHPGVVRYVAHGRLSRGAPYLAMEWLEGEDLARRLARGPLEVGEVLGLTALLAAAIGDLHARGVVHRDLKPANIYLEHGQVARARLLDLGIARLEEPDLADGAGVRTETGMVIGTPAYMAPEQARADRAVDARADLFAIGCVIYHCLSGRPPFVGKTALAVLAKVLFEEPVAIGELRPETPASLQRLLGSLLAKDPDGRPSDAGALRALLEGDSGPSTLMAGRGTDTASGPAISRTELRVVSVVVVRPHPAVCQSGVPESGDTLPDLSPEGLRRLVAGGSVGGPSLRVEALAGGTFLACLQGSGTPSDLCRSAARLALQWRDRMRGVTVVLATGRAAVESERPFGEVIDRAALLAEVADPGAVLLDENSAALLESDHDLDGPQGDRPRRLVGPRQGDPLRLLLGRPTRCLGREREIGLCTSLHEECLEEQAARALLVVAPAGTGKSRLVEEVLARLRQRHPGLRAVVARLEAGAAGSPLGLATQLARVVSATAGPLDFRQAHDRLASALPPEQALRVAAFLGQLLGTPVPVDCAELAAARRDPALMATGIREAWVEWMRHCSRPGPMLLLIEDLHWGDRPSVRLLDALLEKLAAEPLCLIATARPEVETIFADLWADRGLHQIRLGALGQKASQELVRAALPGLDEQMVAMVLGRGGGHPFFLEELIRAVASGASAAAVLPDSMLGLLQRRLDGLGEEPRRLLRAAAVFGERFTMEGVRVLLGSGVDLDGLFAELVAREVISAAAEPAGAGGHAFRHAIVREAAYATLPEEERVRAHAVAGRWLAEEGRGTDPLILADHFARGALGEQAALAYLAAGQRAFEGNDLPGCLACLEQARSHGPDVATGARLDLLAGEAHYLDSNLPLAVAAAGRAFAGLPPGSEGWFRAAGRLLVCHGQRGDHREVERLAMLASERAPDPGAEGELAAVLARASSHLSWSDDGDAGAVHGRLHSLAPDPSRFEAAVAGHVLRAEGDHALRVEGDLARARSSWFAAAASFERGRMGEALICTGLALGMSSLIDEDEFTRRDAELTRSTARQGLPPFLESFLKVAQGLGYLMVGRVSESLARTEGLADAVRGNVRLEGMARCLRGYALLEQGELEAARLEGTHCAELSAPAASSQRPHGLAITALALCGSGRRQEAVALAREALVLVARATKYDTLDVFVLAAAGRVLWSGGHGDEAAAAARAALAWLTRLGRHIEGPDFRRLVTGSLPQRWLLALVGELGLELRTELPRWADVSGA